MPKAAQAVAIVLAVRVAPHHIERQHLRAHAMHVVDERKSRWFGGGSAIRIFWHKVNAFSICLDRVVDALLDRLDDTLVADMPDALNERFGNDQSKIAVALRRPRVVSLSRYYQFVSKFHFVTSTNFIKI